MIVPIDQRYASSTNQKIKYPIVIHINITGTKMILNVYVMKIDAVFIIAIHSIIVEVLNNTISNPRPAITRQIIPAIFILVEL